MRTDLDCSYAAGLFDGEGFVQIAKTGGRYFILRARIANNDRKVLEWVRERWGGSIHRKRTHVCSELVITQVAASAFLEDILADLQIKDRQAEIGIALAHAMRFRKACQRSPLTQSELDLREDLRLALLRERASALEVAAT